MKTASTYKDLLAENIALKTECAAVKEQVDAMRANELSLKRRIAYLERMLYGAKSDQMLTMQMCPSILLRSLWRAT